MIKKKKGSKKATEQKSVKKRRKPRLKKEINLAEVRKRVSRIVQGGATELTQAVVKEGMKGQVGPVRYLFEMANIFPVQENSEETTEQEDCFAKILLSRMDAPAKAEKEDDEGDDAELSAADQAKAIQTAAVCGQECPGHTLCSGGEEKKETATPVGIAGSVT